MKIIVTGIAAWAAIIACFGGPSLAATGTIQGTVTTQGGLPLNGMCGILYNLSGTKQITTFAGTGVTGTAGFYTQANVKPGRYKLLFTNCGANTNGMPDPNYVWIFLGSTYSPHGAMPVVVTSGGLTNLPPQPVPLGGTVQGTITDAKTKMGADTPVYGDIPPGGLKFVLSSGIGLNCASQQGQYSAAGYLATSKVYFAPPNWGCPNSKGVFNYGFYVPKKSAAVGVGSDQTVTVNGTIKETSLCCGVAQSPGTRLSAVAAVPVRR